ncbi:MAG: hypothetical protein Tsb0020_50520 [Haliangiales bacterium]
MDLLLYGELVPWYRLLDPPESHRDEALCFRAGFERAIVGPAESLLELGAGAGHNACHLTDRFRCTLSDVSEPMLELSRALNPDSEHLVGDMRSLRLERSFDAVLVHDAVVYMTTEEELRAAIETAFVHTRPGGAAIFAPDEFRDTFVEASNFYEGSDGPLAMRCIEWSWDPDPDDTECCAEYAFLLRDGDQLRAVHDRHRAGLFPQATWRRLLTEAGFRVEVMPRPIGDGEFDGIFLCSRP